MATCGSEEGEISAAAQLSAMFPDLEWEVSLTLLCVSLFLGLLSH